MSAVVKYCDKSFSKNCKNVAVKGYSLCSTCNEMRLEKIKNKVCSANDTCQNKPNTQFPWCRWCHAKKMIKQIVGDHNCSSRGGVACSECEANYIQASPYLKTLNKKPPTVS